MKYYRYHEPIYDDNLFGDDEVVTMSEKEVLDSYYPYWVMQIKKVHGTDYFLTRSKQELDRQCIEDWVVVNWAYEVGGPDA